MAKAELTPRLVDTLPVEPGRQRTVYFDEHRDAPKGFALRVTAKGGRAYYLVASSKRYGRRWVHIGGSRTLGLDKARAAARARAGEIAMGADPVADARAARLRAQAARANSRGDSREWSVSDLLDSYLAAKLESLSPVTVKTYRREARLVADQLGTMAAREVLKDDVRRAIGRIAKRAPAQAAHVLAFLRAAFRWGMDEEQLVVTDEGRRLVRSRIDRDPTRRIEHELPKVRAASRRRRERHLSDDEIVKFWRGLEGAPASWATFARTILLCGTRRGETHAARWADLDLDSPTPTWRIPSEARKGRVAGSRGERRGLVIPLSQLAAELLRDLRQVTARAPGAALRKAAACDPKAPARWREFAFRSMGFSVGLIGDRVKEATGLQDVSIHDVRRTCSSGLQRLGAPPHVISVVLGHAREKGATDADTHYMHDRREAEHRLWLERWARHVEQLLKKDGRRGADVVPIGGSAAS